MLVVQLFGELVCVGGAADWRVGLCWCSCLESWFVLVVQLIGELVCVDGAADWRIGLCW